MQQTDESALIARSLEGDQDTYGTLVDRYKRAIYHHCFAMVRDEDVAEDIAQETFIIAYYKLRLYKPEYRFSTWVFKIATNKSLDWLKRTARQVAVDDELIAEIASTQPGPVQQAKNDELRTAVERLRPNYRAVISLYYWQGLSYDEIATVLAVPIGSVRGWISRAKQQLREELS